MALQLELSDEVFLPEIMGALARNGCLINRITPKVCRVVYPRAEDARELLSAEGVDVDAIAPQVDGKFMSAFVRAVKPAKEAAKTCCGPSCCN